MREVWRALPGIEGVAGCAVLTQLARVNVAMARYARRVQPHQRAVDRAPVDYGAKPGIKVLPDMALGAAQSSVFAFELPAGLSVIELLFGNRPADQPALLAVVFGMAAGAVITACAGLYFSNMVAALLRNAQRDFPMAFQALQFRLPFPEGMALRAGKRAGEFAVRAA